MALDQDSDNLSSLLIAQLALDDITEIRLSNKGKSPANYLKSDEELAFQIQAEELQLLLGDNQLARSLDQALRTDQQLLGAFAEIERGEEDDHRLAVAIAGGSVVPTATARQRMLEVISTTSFEPTNAAAETDSHSVTIFPRAEPVAGSSTSSARSFLNEERNKQTTLECAICMEYVNPSSSLHAPCGHSYCDDCLVSLVENTIRDESLYPLRCCKLPLSVEQVLARVRISRPMIVKSFRTKVIEFDTPSSNRLYCWNAICSAFLGSKADDPVQMRCQMCRSSVCTRCGNEAHPGEDCAQNLALTELKKLAQERGWQTCPGCNAIVELQQGCYHMTCRCKAQFCYLCAALWKTCRCLQWDEGRLLNAAEQQVVNQFGRRARAEEPDVYHERVQARAADLRENHHCAHVNWRYRSGGGMCEQCNFNLPTFLLRCRGCQMLACVRCTRNRL